MKPAASIVIFTTVSGTAQGVAVALAAATLAESAPAALRPMLWAVAALLLAALAASFFHLGHPLRAWRAVLMWRTSWMSREVIALPAFLLIVAAWAWQAPDWPAAHPGHQVFAWLVIVGSLVLWYCTAMIYASIRFIQEWAHPLTIVNYVTLGLASGLVACGALAVAAGERDFAQALAPWALASTAIAWFTRWLSLRRNASLKPRSTVQSATGIPSARIVQKSMGMTGGSFNTREFFHGASTAALRSVRIVFQVFAFAIPLLLLAWAQHAESGSLWLFAVLSQTAGLLAERWLFFAQARHPQNIYYQVVS
ncbi:dimethyl sulfoxide reductase anchor subunit [Ramlibacter tataouinensis]|uniref:dimethyl sulfoxide reductase anchor subunit family protein n=1 Tax=Ramlibacter tataouinensis TaxID=94132 RepID=UPI0022F39903|nr:DmsC/YnfH family molybdoenzyme membrane anchor subunit [Ramlibacter tataouinensis]WBY01066.1 dimethyl sulfoxide reductase anchor subunit [Ramlibacter tataouinensis]